jgi:hypothetical protein
MWGTVCARGVGMRSFVQSCLLLCLVSACGATAESSPTTSDRRDDELGERRKPPVLPHAGGTGAEAAWGGSDASRWRPEAMLANATSEALNRGWALPNAKDVLVAVPVRMFSSPFSEFGDGQLNAVAERGAWPTKERPAVVATLVHFTNAPSKLLLRLDRTLPTNVTTVEVVYFANNQRKLVDVPVARTSSSDLEGEWLVPDEVGFSSLVSSAAIALHPKGWGDWFPIGFRAGVRPIAELRASGVRFGDGKPVIDREAISVQREATPIQTPFQRLASHAFAVPYNNGQRGGVVPFNPQDIHARFPFNGGMVVTGVGQGFTWVADERPSGFKVMYTCFEGRNPSSEASAPQGGVASGGGWHYIGDAAETILNDLEGGPLVVGAASTNPFWPAGLPSGGFAYGLSDVAVVRWLYPGEAFVTPRGPGLVDDGRGGQILQDNFHWYYFHGRDNVCTEELVNTGAVPTDFQP